MADADAYVDTRLAGSPLVDARGPAEEIRDWFYWYAMSSLELPGGIRIRGGMLTDHVCLRVIEGAKWIVHRQGQPDEEYDPGSDGRVLYFGPQTKHMALSVTGSFRILTVHLRAGAARVLGGPQTSQSCDSVLDHAELAGHGNLALRFDPAASDEEWMRAMDAELGKFVASRAYAKPDPVIVEFEKASLSKPDLSIARFAEDRGMSVRTLERTVRRDYGIPPKLVLRRARALDMAAAILGVVDPAEEHDLAMRYFDQSHLIREIRHFFGVTPRELGEQADPLLRVNLEIRQSRRLEALGRWTPDQPLPWRR